MDNINNNSEFPEGGFTYPADDGASVQDFIPVNQDDAVYAQGYNMIMQDDPVSTDGYAVSEEPVYGQTETQPVFSQGQYPQPPEWTQNIVVSDKPWIENGENGNVSVQLNESQKVPEPMYIRAAEMYGADKKKMPLWMQVGIVILALLAVIVLMKHALNIITPSEENVDLNVNAVTVVPTVENTESTTVPTTAPVTEAYTEKNTEAATESTTAEKKEEKTTAKNKKPSANSAETSTDEKTVKAKVIEYFNESSNKVKTDAVKVVKNFENRTHNEDKLELPAVIKSVGKGILESKIAGVSDPVEYTTSEDIISRYPAPGQEWSSTLTEEEVETATCVENGNEYEITIKLYDCVDPEPGKGTSKAMDCLDVPTVRDTAPPFITAFSAEYYDCVIRCRVDKETGRVIWANYTTPVVMKVGLDAGFTQFDAEIGITFEKDYTITY